MLPPRILLVMPEQWPRALLRAELRDVGYDAVGARALPSARFQAGPRAGRGPVRLIVLDQDALTDSPDFHALRQASDAPILLIAPALRGTSPGPWARVVRRPISVGELVNAVQRLAPLEAEARRPIE